MTLYIRRNASGWFLIFGDFLKISVSIRLKSSLYFYLLFKWNVCQSNESKSFQSDVCLNLDVYFHDIRI